MKESKQPKIESGWFDVLKPQFESTYFAALKQFLLEEKKHYPVFPPGPFIFQAFNLTPFRQVKVVILGQDPYHGPGQAHGLSFSVPPGIEIPPSLRNIYKELQADTGFQIPVHGNLEKWAAQGVLLLNATLTVRMGQPTTHKDKGWERFTDAAIKAVSEGHTHLVFMLWGNFAAAKESLIDNSKHLILKAPHPSPLSASRGFLGCRHFSKTNDYLISKGKTPIDWQI